MFPSSNSKMFPNMMPDWEKSSIGGARKRVDNRCSPFPHWPLYLWDSYEDLPSSWIRASKSQKTGAPAMKCWMRVHLEIGYPTWPVPRSNWWPYIPQYSIDWMVSLFFLGFNPPFLNRQVLSNVHDSLSSKAKPTMFDGRIPVFTVSDFPLDWLVENQT